MQRLLKSGLPSVQKLCERTQAHPITQTALANPSQSAAVVITLISCSYRARWNSTGKSWPSGEGKELFNNGLKYLNKLELMILNM